MYLQTAILVRWLTRLLLATVAASAVPPPCAAQRAGASHDARVSLDHRMTAFIAAVRREGVDSIAAFFPRTGTLSYVRTRHAREGTTTGRWDFSPVDALQAIRRGPLRPSFTINREGQTIGLLAHQVMHRGPSWRRVRGSRFVPPGAPASSPAFVEWRRERGEWVVSAVGDESFKGVPLPAWCC